MRVTLTVIPLILVIFGGIIGLVSLKLREEVREQIISRDAEVLYPVALMYLSQSEEDVLLDPLADPYIGDTADLLDVVLSTSELKGVFAVRLFDIEGRFSGAVPAEFLKGELAKEDMEEIRKLRPVSHFRFRGRLGDYFVETAGREQEEGIPLLKVILPLHINVTGEVLGVAQYLIDGSSVVAEFEELDKNIGLQAVVAFASGSLIIGLILFWAFRRLRKSNKLLEERSRRLLEANTELTLAAKTSAIGAVSAHLIHGLKNPLSGLQEFVADRNRVTSDQEREGEWEAAVETAQRMQTMIQEIVSVLQEEEHAAEYEYSIEEIREIIGDRAEPIAKKKGVHFQADAAPDGSIDSRRGNLLLLILMNLIQNAIEATPAGNRVWLSFKEEENNLEISVSDTGGGLPDYVQENLFSPCRSTKENGSGVGLAISQQLAKHIQGELALEETGPGGTRFHLGMCLERRLPNRDEEHAGSATEVA